LFGPSASDKYVDELLANLNNGKLEDILTKLPRYSEESILSKSKQKAQGQNVDHAIDRIKDIMAERDIGEFGERY
jgi:ribosome assembly protein YihI (activator of Der GTPase)